MKIPEIGIEPGRSLVGDAGITLVQGRFKKRSSKCPKIFGC